MNVAHETLKNNKMYGLVAAYSYRDSQGRYHPFFFVLINHMLGCYWDACGLGADRVLSC